MPWTCSSREPSSGVKFSRANLRNHLKMSTSHKHHSRDLNHSNAHHRSSRI
jgi:hypothetical protein